MKLTEKQLVILEAVAWFKYLTTKQLQMIFFDKNRSAINSALRDLKACKYPLIKSLEFGVNPGRWRYAAIHHLTESGKRLLVEELGYKEKLVLCPARSSTFFQRDYYHRIATIDFNIRFQQWVWMHGYQIGFFHCYFTKLKRGESFRSITALPLANSWIEPDGVGLYIDNGIRKLFLFEMHNGNDANRAIKQIEKHYQAMVMGLYSIKYQVSRVARIVYVFEKQTCMEKVMGQFMANPKLQKLKKYFLFNHIDNLERRFPTYWQSPNGDRVRFT